MNYQEFKNARQEDFNALPVKFAFSNEQFKKMMSNWGLSENDTDKIYRLGNTGGFYLKSDAPIIKAWMDRDYEAELDELMQDEEFAVDAYYYEMCNHEYIINYDGDWDVLRCFGKESIEELDEKQLQFYKKARSKYRHDAIENDWF